MEQDKTWTRRGIGAAALGLVAVALAPKKAQARGERFDEVNALLEPVGLVVDGLTNDDGTRISVTALPPPHFTYSFLVTDPDTAEPTAAMNAQDGSTVMHTWGYDPRADTAVPRTRMVDSGDAISLTTLHGQPGTTRNVNVHLNVLDAQGIITPCEKVLRDGPRTTLYRYDPNRAAGIDPTPFHQVRSELGALRVLVNGISDGGIITPCERVLQDGPRFTFDHFDVNAGSGIDPTPFHRMVTEGGTARFMVYDPDATGVVVPCVKVATDRDTGQVLVELQPDLEGARVRVGDQLFAIVRGTLQQIR